MHASAVLVAAGASRRMGFDKLTAPLAGHPLLVWSLCAFQNCPDIAEAVLVCAPERLSAFTALAAPFPKFRHIIPGGPERSASVLLGLQALASHPPTLVAVHDAARPLVTPALITQTLAAAAQHRAAAAAQPVSDSLHRANATGALHETLLRDRLFAMQTPQAAQFEILLAALQAHHAGATDEVSALIAHGLCPVPVLHDTPNFKITYPQDVPLAEAVLASRASAFPCRSPRNTSAKRATSTRLNLSTEATFEASPIFKAPDSQ